MKKYSYLLFCLSLINLISCNKNTIEDSCDPRVSDHCASETCERETCVSFITPKREDYKITTIYHIMGDENGNYDSCNYYTKTSSKDFTKEENYSTLFSNLFDLIDFFLSRDTYEEGAEDYDGGKVYTTRYTLYPIVNDGKNLLPFYFGFRYSALFFNINSSTYITKGNESFLSPLLYRSDLDDERKEIYDTIKPLTESILEDVPAQNIQSPYCD